MPVFAVVLRDPNHEVEQRLLDKYPGSFQFTETVFLVQANGIPDAVAKDVGIKGDDRIATASGAVFRLDGAYSGYTTRALWDWLKQADEQQ